MEAHVAVINNDRFHIMLFNRFVSKALATGTVQCMLGGRISGTVVESIEFPTGFGIRIKEVNDLSNVLCAEGSKTVRGVTTHKGGL
jgi:hypothetical protein